jgi:hypothetical protein
VILAFYSEESGVGKVVCADALGYEGTREQKVAFVDRLKLHGHVLAPIRVPMTINVGGDPVFQHPIREVEGRAFIIGLLGSPGKGNGIRGLDEGFWTRQVIDRAREAKERGAWTVISDMRFLEEQEAIHQAGGWIVEVIRPHGSLGRHNEQRVRVDHVIVNDGSLDDLRGQVESYLNKLQHMRAHGS